MAKVSLPVQIILLASAVFLLFVSALWFSVFSIRNEMDDKAFEDSLALVRQRVEGNQEQVQIIASDYNNWNDVYDAASRRDVKEIASNYGITAARGDVFQYAEMFDGPFVEPIAWVAGKGLVPQQGFLAQHTREIIAQHAGNLESERRETIDFFEMIDGHVVMVSASKLLPENLDRLTGEEDIGLAAIGKILRAEKLRSLEKELSVTALTVSLSRPRPELAQLALIGSLGSPVAWLTWNAPKPGTELFKKMFAILLGVSAAFGGLTILATGLVHTKARALIRKEAEAADQARTDALTGLPNRFGLHEYIRRLDARDVAVLAIDLDKFKQVNDVLGHSGGDAYLKEVASRLDQLVDKQTFVARIGGDEFIAVFSANEKLRAIVDEKISILERLFGEKVTCGGFALDVFAAKGMAISTGGAVACADLLHRADRAMYHAKAHRSQEVTLYDGAMESRDFVDRGIERALRLAIANRREFQLVYQPIVDPRRPEQLVRAEALLRWNSVMLGNVAPGDFIPVAEKTGLIFDLGWMILDMACRDLHLHPALQISLNVSPMQLMAPGFATNFATRVGESGIDSRRIEIEVTENIVIQDDDVVARELNSLRQAGFRIALDDFGTGYSSIGYLGCMPFDQIKIDRSFVSDVSGASAKFCMVNSMISLAHSMNITVVAEGVEREEELEKLVANGCDYVQGFLLGRPGTVASICARFGLRDDIIDATISVAPRPVDSVRQTLPDTSGPVIFPVIKGVGT